VAEQHDESEAASSPEKTGPESTEVAHEASDASQAEGGSESEGVEVERPAAPKKKKKKRELAAEAANAPSRDRNRRLREELAGGGRKAPREATVTRNLGTAEIVDDALARSTQAAGEWLKKNFNVVQWFIIAGLVGWVGYAIYNYRAARAAEQASTKLTTAIRAEGARIGPEDSKPDPQTGIVETRPAFPTNTDRLKAAETQYRAIADAGSTAAASFARLGLASVLYDESKYADAKAAYDTVKSSKLASADVAVKGRAIEGIGMCWESLGNQEEARKAYAELANVEGLNFGVLGAYHQARLAFAAGDTEKAKELLKDAQKRLDAAQPTDSKRPLGDPGYLQQSVRDLLRRVDPSAVSPSPNGLTAEQIQELSEQMGSPAGPGGKGMSSEKLNELLKRLSKTGGAPSTPAPPASAP